MIVNKLAKIKMYTLSNRTNVYIEKSTLVTLVDKAHSVPDIGMLLPERNYNQCLIDEISRAPKSYFPKGVIAGLFLSDPFLHLPSALAVLQSAGLTGVANFPSTSFYGNDFANQLDTVGFSREQEFERLLEVQKSGLNAVGCINLDIGANQLRLVNEYERFSCWLVHGGLETMLRDSIAPMTFQEAPEGLPGECFLYAPSVTAENLPDSYTGFATAEWW